MQSPYGEDYYMRGAEKGISNYTDYRWMEERTMAHAQRLMEVLDIIPHRDTVLDWGCARGYTVKALRRLGVQAYGHDISEWAIENCDPEVKDYVTTGLPLPDFDHILAKDVMEHMEPIGLETTTATMLRLAKVSIFIMVPLTEKTGGQYVRKEDDMDVTHKIRWPLEEWMQFFHKRIPAGDWVMEGSWHLPGLKPSSLSHPKSCGFIVLGRTSQGTAP